VDMNKGTIFYSRTVKIQGTSSFISRLIQWCQTPRKGIFLKVLSGYFAFRITDVVDLAKKHWQYAIEHLVKHVMFLV
jgi:hypothetical protein